MIAKLDLSPELLNIQITEKNNHQKNHRQQAMVSVFLWLA